MRTRRRRPPNARTLPRLLDLHLLGDDAPVERREHRLLRTEQTRHVCGRRVARIWPCRIWPCCVRAAALERRSDMMRGRRRSHGKVVAVVDAAVVAHKLLEAHL
eukprot:7186792-Prymnesium_polylepis.1